MLAIVTTIEILKVPIMTCLATFGSRTTSTCSSESGSVNNVFKKNDKLTDQIIDLGDLQSGPVKPILKVNY